MKPFSLREWTHAAGRVLTRVLLHPRWHHHRLMRTAYVQLYLLGKRVTEHAELRTMRSMLSQGMVVADVGANVGFYTFAIASAVGPTGRVMAFEPDPFSVNILQARRSRKRADNVEVHPVAIADRPGKRLLYRSPSNRADNRLHPSHEEPGVEPCEVQVCSMDEFLSSRDRPAIDAMKIDVQGSEEQVLRGALQTVGRGLQWIWIEFSPSHLRGAGTDPIELLAFLDELGMDVFELDQNGQLRGLADPHDYVRRIGPGHGDLVLMSQMGARSRRFADANQAHA